jgi:hypothetical protein
MTPLEIPGTELRQFDLLVKRSGVLPDNFRVRKFRLADDHFRTDVNHGAADFVYTAPTPTGWMNHFAVDLDAGRFGVKVPRPLGDITAQVLALAEKQLAEGGLPALLAFLNARVPHRFTALYRLEAGMQMRNVAAADKHRHLEALDLQVVPLNDSYCQFVLRDGLFVTEDSGMDPRLTQHPYAGVVGCYVGVPVCSVPGRMDGTLCHFDTESCQITEDEFILLDRVALLLPGYLGAAPAT